MNSRAPQYRRAPFLLSLVGGINAGKTYYLVNLIHELINPSKETRILLKKLGISRIDMTDPDSIQMLDNLINVVDSDGRLPGTSPHKEGLFRLLMNIENDTEYEVILFNSSGEKIEDEIRKRLYATNSQDMKGTAHICLIDPREDSGLNKILERPNAYSCANINFSEHFHKVMQKLYGGVQYVSNPIAICISKFDLLLHRRPMDIPAEPFIEASSRHFFNDINTVSRQLKPFLQNNSLTIDPEDLDDKFTNISYFGVAPFGKDELPYHWDSRKPLGLLAPFLWVLKESKILKDDHGIH